MRVKNENRQANREGKKHKKEQADARMLDA